MDTKKKSRKLRLAGNSLLEIHKLTGIPKSTVRLWCKDIILTNNQKSLLNYKRIQQSTKRLKIQQEKRRLEIKVLREKLNTDGINDLKIYEKEPLFYLGLGLYWGEGYKFGNQEVGISNSDPRIMLLSMKWFKKFYNIENKDFVARLGINSTYKDKVEEILKFWSKMVELPLSQFTKTSLINTSFKRIYPDTNHNGTLRIKINKPLRIRQRILSSIENAPDYIK